MTLGDDVHGFIFALVSGVMMGIFLGLAIGGIL